MRKSILGVLTVIAVVLMMSLQSVAQPGGGRGTGGRDRGPGGPGGAAPGGTRDRGPGGPGGAAFGGFGGGNSLANPEVQKLLGLSAEQTEQLKKIQEESRPPRPEGNARPTTPPSAEDAQKFIAEAEKRSAERLEKENKVLTAEQQKQLAEISFQLSGGLDARRLNVSGRSLDALNLTADQKTQIQKLVADRDAENRAAFEKVDFRNATAEERTKLRTEGEERNKKFAEQVKSVLTDAQKATAEKLTKEAPALREKLGIRAGGGAGTRGGEGTRGERGTRGSDTYRPGANSWRPGDATPDKEGEAAPAPPRSRFPRTE